MKTLILTLAVVVSAGVASAGTPTFSVPQLWFPDSFTSPSSPTLEDARSSQGQ